MNPFAVLGLPEWPDLEDETVRAAWVAIVAETSPDRADGGDPGRFAEACMAYFELNNAWGRSVAYAELIGGAGSGPGTPPVTTWPVVFVLEPGGPWETLRRIWRLRIGRHHDSRGTGRRHG